MEATETIEVLVVIRAERLASIAVVPGDIDGLTHGRHPLIWLPRAEIIALKPEANNRVTLTLPRWLADAERLISRAEDNAAQGELL